MNCYVYRNKNITINIWAYNETIAFRLLIERISELENMGVRGLDAQDFDLVSAF
jgi:hypothetical protein